MDFKKKQKSDATLKSFFIRVAAFLAAVAVIVLMVANVKIYRQRKAVEAEISKYDQRIAELKERNEKLKEEIASSDDAEYIEKIAREEQGMQKEGEKVVSFVLPDDADGKTDVIIETFGYKNWFGWLSNSWNWLKKMF
jgi:cell division protein FtsL